MSWWKQALIWAGKKLLEAAADEVGKKTAKKPKSVTPIK